jgi:branched-chain amino acid transport system permease protein
MNTLCQLFFNGLFAGALYALIAISFAIIYNTAGFFHFAHAAVYTLAAYGALWLNLHRWPIPLAIAVAITLSACLGATMEFLVYRPLRNKGSSRAVLLISSLGMLIALQNVVSLCFGDATQALLDIRLAPFYLFGATITLIQAITLLTSLVAFILLYAWLRSTKAGLTLRAVSNDPELSQVLGIKTGSVLVLAFALGSCLAGIAGILSGLDTDLTPLMGFRAVLIGVSAVIVGGMGSLPGAVIGGLLIGFAQQFAAWTMPTQWQDSIVFGLVIVFFALRPQGVCGTPWRGATL